MSASFILRPAAVDDEEFLFALFRGTRTGDLAMLPGDAELVEGLLRMQFRAQRLQYAAQFPEAEHSIVMRAGLPVGRMLVSRSAAEVRLVDIALLPDERNQGIGSGLLAALLAEAAAAGKPVRLQVWKANPAVRLYARSGFRTTGDSGVYLQMEWRPGAAEPPQ